LPAVRPGTSDSAQNSQCVLSGVGTNSVVSGDSRSVTYTLVFKYSPADNLSQYARATYAGNYDTGYQATGTYQVKVRRGAQVVSLSPSSASGRGQSFVVRFRHPDGIQSLYYVHLLLNNPFGGRGACYLAFIQGTNSVQLASDDEVHWPSIPLGSTQTLSNSQCSVSGAGSLAVESGTELLLQLDVTFKPVFAGQRRIWLHAVDRAGQDAGFVEKGLFQVLGGGS
jgi:hypothetical protein